MQGHAFSVPRQTAKPATPVASPFDLLASDYDAWFEEEGKLVFATEVEAFRRSLPYLPKPWLEIGVGSGRFAQALGIEVGIDRSTKLLEIARRRGVATFLSRGERSPFHEYSFGTVFLIATLCFVDSPVAVLQESHRMLYPGGKIALGLILQDSPWGQYYLTKKQSGHRFYRYATFYTYPQLEELLRHTGFAVGDVASTLFQKPDEVREVEAPREGISSNAGFTVITARRRDNRAFQ